jgi:hypothetical protein
MGNQPETTKTRRRAGRDQATLIVLAPDAPISLTEAAILASISPRHLAEERSAGRGPKCYRLGAKAIRTTVGDVLAWVRSRAEVVR